MEIRKTEDRWGIIYVPKPGVRRTHKRWEHILAYLEEKDVKFDFVQSEGVSSVNRLTQMLINNGYRMLVIVGGDAALNEAVNGIMAFGDPIVSEVSLGVIPNGFGNNFANFWGIEEDEYKKSIDFLIRKRIRKIDVGLCYYHKENEVDSEELRYFINAVNIGLGASIIGITEQAERLVGVKFFARIFSSLRLLFERITYKTYAEINHETFEGNVTGLCVGSCLGYGQTPNAVPYNGMVDVSIVQLPHDIRQLFLGLYLLISGKFLNYNKVLPYRAREVKIERADHARISVDGRFLKTGKFPIRINVMQERLNFIIPSRPLGT